MESLGLTPTLKKYTEHFEKENNIKTLLKIDLAERLPAALEIAIFRIVQEALNNTKKHSQASHAMVGIGINDGAINVKIEDNGKGFDLRGDSQGQKGYGLISMKERTESLGGEVDTITQPGAGTKITATIPLNVPMEIEQWMR
ncbi:MAG: hypothetical protein HY776_06580 [Actinobacteria bacterium]|nr:hypothetical protein [Actinomycetota bacterium]